MVVDSQIPKTLFRAANDVVVREDIRDIRSRRRRPDAILRRNLRRDVDPMGCIFDDLADQ